jgi:hypothetical protein
MSMDAATTMKMFSGINGLAYGVDTAIKALRPGAVFDMVAGNGEIQFPRWEDPNGLPPPTKAEVDAEFEYQKALSEYYQYAYDRCKEYPDGFEQLDMIWHAINNGVDLKDSEWFNAIKEVKEKHPKPEGDPPTKE